MKAILQCYFRREITRCVNSIIQQACADKLHILQYELEILSYTLIRVYQYCQSLFMNEI